jgi:hypothetical protein
VGRQSRWELLRVCPTPPVKYFDFSFFDQLEWNIDHFLPNVVDWTKRWLNVYDSGRHKILLTTFSNIVSSEERYLFKILDFYKIDHGRFRPSVIEKTIHAMHFRVGREDEWQESFTADQLRRARDIIGNELIKRFGWPH